MMPYYIFPINMVFPDSFSARAASMTINVCVWIKFNPHTHPFLSESEMNSESYLGINSEQTRVSVLSFSSKNQHRSGLKKEK
jgi:hypothetical protein